MTWSSSEKTSFCSVSMSAGVSGGFGASPGSGLKDFVDALGAVGRQPVQRDGVAVAVLRDAAVGSREGRRRGDRMPGEAGRRECCQPIHARLRQGQ